MIRPVRYIEHPDGKWEWEGDCGCYDFGFASREAAAADFKKHDCSGLSPAQVQAAAVAVTRATLGRSSSIDFGRHG